MDQQQPNPAPVILNEGYSRGKRTTGHKILIFFAFIAIIVVCATFLAVNAENMTQQQGEPRREDRLRSPEFVNSSILESELFAAASRGAPLPEPVSVDAPVIAPQAKTQIVILRPAPVSTPTRKKQIRQISDSERELARRYRDMKNNAIMSKSGVDGFMGTDERAPEQRTASNYIPPNTASQYELPSEAMQALTQGMQKDSNGQTQKLDFLLKDSVGRTPQGYSTNTRNAPLARMELKAGTIIPGLLLTGLNSDLPGTIMGQVSENVYDTATGLFMLIPQGTRILGVYDSRITQGQKRVGVVWNRLIYPDGSSLNIAGSPGTDLAGYSGIKGTVDNHYGQLLSAAFFTSIFASAADIATGGRNNDNNNNNDSKSVRDILVETLGTEIAEIGAKMADRALDIQPTIKINPGQRFNVIVQQDVVFLQPWNPGNIAITEF
jgi:type IV secretion system protein VirB10